MARMEFVTAAKNAEAEEKGEQPKPFEFTLAGEDFTAKLPSGAQLSVLSASLGEGGDAALQTALNIFDAILENKGGARIRRLLAKDIIRPAILFWGDELNEQGVIGALVEQFTGRPTTPSSASSESPKSAGRRSTGRAPSKGSTRSDSPSTDS